MNAIELFLQTLQNLNLNELIQKVVKDNENQLVELITQEQIYKKGIDGTGNRIKGKKWEVYSPVYTKEKASLGLYQGYVDLSLSGEWLRSWYISFDSDGFTIMSGVVMTDEGNLGTKLMKQYGSAIESLTDENKGKLVEIIKTGLQNEIIQKIKTTISTI